MRILDRGMRPRRSLQEPTISSDKICSLEAQKDLATFWYNKILQVANSGSTWGWCLLEGIKNSDLISLGR